MMTPEILIIEHDEETRHVLRTAFAEHYDVREASSVAAGVLLATQRLFDLIVLDPGLPDGNEILVIRKVREAKPNIPIIVYSAHFNERERIAALDAGADDFIRKPVSTGELLARVRVALRRLSNTSGHTSQAIYRTGEIEVNLNNRRIHVAGVEVHLTRRKYKLLEVLIRHADRIVTRECLLNDVWGPGRAGQVHYLRTYLHQLRRKLETDAYHPRYLLTEPGVGYRLATQHFPEAWKDKVEKLHPAVSQDLVNQRVM